MNEIYNGISARELPASLIWKKSERSNPSGNCVELANLPDGQGIAMRNSRDPQGPVLVYTKDEIDAFVRGAQDGDFNHLIA
ncbi:MAG TPA: DUF397 domain-containing protein [Candidatus Stackebrandtia faecavium]|nr:DUF397 domain-containing protein [Candidatus Stackebrandtia faecavium]